MFFDSFYFFLVFFGFLKILFLFFGLYPNGLRLLLKVIEVTTEHQKWPKISKNSTKKTFFLPEGEKIA